MAIAKLAAPLSGLRGKVGGWVFSENGAGPYVKALKCPSNTPTARRTLARAKLAEMPKLWNALTSVQKGNWDTWAAAAGQARTNPLGETYYLSGFGQFCSINTRLLVAGRSTRNAVPTSSYPAAPSITSLTAEAGAAGDVWLTYPVNEFSGFDLVAFASVRAHPGPQTLLARFFLVAADQAPGETETYLTTLFQEKFGQLTATNVVFVNVCIQTTDALRSDWVQVSDVAS